MPVVRFIAVQVRSGGTCIKKTLNWDLAMFENSEARTAAIILAGGKGTRMGSKGMHKCIFEIEGKPAILWLLSSLRSVNILNNVVVVGAYSDQIMKTISEQYPDVAYVFQPEQRGTGNAAKIGALYLMQSGFQGSILIVAGDSFIEPEAINFLIKEFNSKSLDLGLLVKRKDDVPYAGRIVLDDDGKPGASVEYWDIMRCIVVDSISRKIDDILSRAGRDAENGSMANAIDWAMEFDAIKKILLAHLKTEGKIQKIFPDFARSLDDHLEKIAGVLSSNEHIKKLVELKSCIHRYPRFIYISGKKHDPKEIEEKSRYVNISVYLCDAVALYKYIHRILSDNAQNEEYLTDLVSILNENGKKIGIVPVNNPNDVMSYNNPEELIAIREYVASKYKHELKPEEQVLEGLKPIDEWISFFQTNSALLKERFSKIYGSEFVKDIKNLEEKREQYIDALKRFKQKFPREKMVFIVRTPGRINLMGRHVDHRGGDVNMMAISRELISVVSPRKDDMIVAYNQEFHKFPARAFSVSEILSGVQWDDWFGFITNQTIINMVRQFQGDWVNYLKAAALRFQVAIPYFRLKGINVFFNGNIPRAAGLSSSSALVVNVLESLCNVNGHFLKPREFIDLCGEGEWFVGT
ncbi:MAG: galactokinase family protein, partial [Promethearchaeota archaeon]